MEPAHSLVNNEIEMEMVPEKYMDVISCEFAYDPVRLPVDQDPTQRLYNRKTLETIWETKCHAQNPFTREWFNAKSVIPQRELRQEMEHYIKLQKFSACKGAELDVIEEYTKILEEEQMKQFLDILGKSLSKQVTTQKQCSTIWKKINLLRLYCQFHCKNIETFRSLHGFRYLNEFIIRITMLLKSHIIGQDTKETAWDVCKEMTRAIDVIGLKPSDIHDVISCPNWKSKEVVLIGGYIKMIDHVYLYNEGYTKIESLMLRLFCKIFYEMNAQVEQILGKELCENIVGVMGPYIVTRKLTQTNAEDISSEDLYYGISILQRSWITTSYLDNPVHSQMLVNAIIICIAREIDRSEEIRRLSEGQLLEAEAREIDRSKEIAREIDISKEILRLSEGQILEAEAERRHNSEALDMGLCLVKEILMTEGPSAANILGGGLYIVEEIVRMFKHFTGEDENEDESNGPVFCAKKGCKIFECIHSRIAQRGLDISTAISRSGEGPPFGAELLLKFVKSESTVSG